MNLIIPYRNRRNHLSQFINHYRESGMKIYVVEQADDKPFNRAKLLNVGFLESDADHYVFHDVDMLCLDGFDIYKPAEVAHLAGRASQFGYRDPYKKMGINSKYFGGVTLFSKGAFLKCDGYSNEFWGWGSEDDEMYNHVRKCGYEVEFRPGRFRSLSHAPADRSMHNQNILLNLKNTEFGRENDGLQNCKYDVLSKENFDNYTLIKVNL